MKNGIQQCAVALGNHLHNRNSRDYNNNININNNNETQFIWIKN